MPKQYLVILKKLSGRNILLYVLAGGVLMWFPVDFIAHEIADLFPETVYYDFSKTVFGFIVLAAVMAIFFLVLKRRSLLELSVATAAVMDTVSGFFYYFLYYYYPATLPANSPQRLGDESDRVTLLTRAYDDDDHLAVHSNPLRLKSLRVLALWANLPLPPAQAPVNPYFSFEEISVA